MSTACHLDFCDEPVSVKRDQLCNAHYLQSRAGKPFRPHRKTRMAATRDEQGRKRCVQCDNWLEVSMFAIQRKSLDGLQPVCRGCRAEYYRGNAELIRDKMRKHRLNLSREEFDLMLEAQGNRCAICKSSDPGSSFWHVDHDHACCPEAGKSCGSCIRGILCGRCNTTIGKTKDDPALLRAMADYLEVASRATTRGV